MIRVQDKGTKGSIYLLWTFSVHVSFTLSLLDKSELRKRHNSLRDSPLKPALSRKCASTQQGLVSFGELGKCLIQQNCLFFPQTKTVHTYFCIVISQSVTIKQSHQSLGSAQKQILELFPVKPHLSKIKKKPSPRGVSHNAELARLLLSSISMHD